MAVRKNGWVDSGAMRSYATRRKGWVESDVPVFGHDQVDARPASELCDGRSGQSAVGEEVEAPRAHAAHRSDLSKWDRHSQQHGSCHRAVTATSLRNFRSPGWA